MPEARRRAAEADVRFAGDAPAPTLVELLGERGAGGAPVGLIGSLPYDQYAVLADGRRVVDLNRAHTRLRLRKCEEEIAALRTAAALTDAAAAALLEPRSSAARSTSSSARVEHAYVSRGGMHHIHYLGITPMSAPDRSVPAQWPQRRPVAAGDLLTFELSAAVAPEYSGQLLRTVAWPPTRPRRCRSCTTSPRRPSTRSPTGCARACTHEELVDAAGVIEEAGFTTVDDLVHGFGGGYLPPVLGSRSRAIRPTPDFTLEAGMTVVVQPNVATPDGRLGVQTGELLLVTDVRARAAAHLPPRPGAGGMSRNSADVVVIGAGHNSLIGAAYLAAAGLEVVVLEEQPHVGGNTVTEELTLPGFRHDSCSSAHVLIQTNPVIRDDELGLLSRYGLRYVHTDPAVVLPLADGDALVMSRDRAETAADLARVRRRRRRRLPPAARRLGGRARRCARPVERRPARPGRRRPPTPPTRRCAPAARTR